MTTPGDPGPDDLSIAPWDTPYMGSPPYDPNHPTGGSNFNPYMLIDTSMAAVEPPSTARDSRIRSGDPTGVSGFAPGANRSTTPASYQQPGGDSVGGSGPTPGGDAPPQWWVDLWNRAMQKPWAGPDPWSTDTLPPDGTWGPTPPRTGPVGAPARIRETAYNDPGAQIARADQNPRQYYPTPEFGPGRTERQQAPEDKFHRTFPQPGVDDRRQEWIPGWPQHEHGGSPAQAPRVDQAADHYERGFAEGRSAAPQFREQLLNAIDNHLVNGVIEGLKNHGINL